MMHWLTENAGTILVSLLLLAIVAGIIHHLIRAKRKGKSACGNNCACCPMCDACHKP